MLFMLMIYASEAQLRGRSEADEQAVREGYMAFAREISERRAFVSGEPLESVSRAKTVRVRDGSSVVTDGPFEQTKEQLGGFYVLKCKDEAEALEYAAKLPTARYGSIEVRPVLEMPD
jgi:hypothetical protein